MEENDDVDEDYINRLHDIEIGMMSYILGFLIIFGVIGNICCFVTMQTKYFRHFRSKFALCALAVADTGVLLSSAMHQWTTAITDFELDLAEDSRGACKMVYFTSDFFVLLSVWTLVLVTIERMITVLRPHRAHILCSHKRIIFAWCTIFVVLILVELYIPILYDFYDLSELYHINGTSIHCDFPPEDINMLNDVLYYLGLVLGSLVPSACIIVINGVIIRQLSRKPEDEADVLAEGVARKGRSVTVMLVVVSVVFVVCTLPMRITDLLADELFSGYRHDDTVDAKYSFTISCLSMLYFTNNAVNFILYAATGSRFRRAFLELFCPCRRRSSSNEINRIEAESVSFTVLKTDIDEDHTQKKESSLSDHF